MASESNLETRLTSCIGSILVKKETLKSFVAVPTEHIINVQALNIIVNQLSTVVDLEGANMQCENSKRSIETMGQLINLERRRRMLSALLEDATKARKKKAVIEDLARNAKRARFSSYGNEKIGASTNAQQHQVEIQRTTFMPPMPQGFTSTRIPPSPPEDEDL